MSTLGPVFESVVLRLIRAGADAPHLDAKWLLAHVLAIEPGEVATQSGRSVSAVDLARLDGLVAERGRGVPLAYLLGEWEFWSLPLFVTSDVLVPRPETELLVEWGSALLRDDPEPRIADIGTGSGCIAVALATMLPAATIDAVDLSTAALAVAARNVARHKLEDRVRLLEGDLLAPLADHPVYDLIVSNPPYITPGDPRLEANVAAHEPALALYDKEVGDGLGFYRRLLEAAPGRLFPRGSLLLELPEDGAATVRESAEARGFTVEMRRDLAGIERALLCQWNGFSGGTPS